MASSTIEVKIVSDEVAVELCRRIAELEERLAVIESRSPYRPLEFAAQFGTSSHPHTAHGPRYSTRSVNGFRESLGYGRIV